MFLIKKEGEKMNTDELKKAIEAKKAEIEEKKKQIDSFELDVDEYVEQYEDALNTEGLVKVGGLTFEPATIIRELDPTAYRCGLLDYVDSIEKSEVKEYQDLEEELEALEDELIDLENELKEKEEE
jgi:predicted  nucleic acid-binding Zn-ribbon protein